jgi:hypothetical protein
VEQDREMPSALALARAMAGLLNTKLDDYAAASIVLTREEAALCLGLISGIAENLEREARPKV